MFFDTRPLGEGGAAVGDGVLGEGELVKVVGVEDEHEEVVVRAGEVLHIPSNVWHKAEAIEDTLDVDVFSPPRQDWLDGTDSYFHQK